MDKGERFLKLERELADYNKPLGEASDIMLVKEITKYPIFVVHQQEVSIGIPIMEKDKIQGNWSVNASTLEEFATKQIVKEDMVKNFMRDFKDPANYLCIFSLSELGAQFIYIKRT